MSALAVSFNEIQLNVESDQKHTYLMPTKEVAKGYGLSEQAVRNVKKRHSDELSEGEHFIVIAGYAPRDTKCVAGRTPIKRTLWTKLGVIYLGFFIKSERAKQFRKFAADLVLDTIEKKRPGRKALGKKLEIATDQLPDAIREKRYITESRLIDIGRSLSQAIVMQTWRTPGSTLKPTAFMPPIKRCIDFGIPIMYREPLYDIEDIKKYIIHFLENVKFAEHAPRI